MAQAQEAPIGFIGLGTMGARMAANLQKAGFKLIVNDLREASAKPFLDRGAEWARSPQAVAEQTRVFFTSLPEPTDVEAVALGTNGLLASAKAGDAYFDLSTNSPIMVKKLEAAFAQKGAH